jgi:RNA polymerase sigma factor (TIGR02999 family)
VDIPPGEVTRLLGHVRGGDRGAFDRLVEVVYAELRQLARAQLRRERGEVTLDATALVHEAYERLADHADLDWEGRAHFFGVAARAMRQVLVDHARKRNAAKRGGGWDRASISLALLGRSANLEEILALDEALARLEPRQRQVVEYRFFAGLTDREIAALLGVSSKSVQRDWAKARAWLYRDLYANPEEDPT